MGQVTDKEWPKNDDVALEDVIQGVLKKHVIISNVGHLVNGAKILTGDGIGLLLL